MSDYEDEPSYDDEEEDMPNGTEPDASEDSERSENEENVETPEPGKEASKTTVVREPAEVPEQTKAAPENGQPELCPYCGQPLSQRLINGKIWYIHEGNTECRAVFQGVSALKEARDTKAVMEEEQRKEKERKDREEKAKLIREEAEKPFRDAAQKTADFAVEVLKEQMEKLQKQYAELLEAQAKDLETARQKLETLLGKDIPIQIPERSKISNAIEAYKTKLNQSSAGDPNAASYEYLENSFNELLAARDDAEALIQSTDKAAQAIKHRLEAAIKDAQEKMEQAAADGKEYESIQNAITQNGQGTVLALEKQLENLERLFFRKA